MICKYRLRVKGQVIPLDDSSIENWGEINYAMKRSKFGGVLRSFSSSFKFVGKAAELLLEEYRQKYLSSAASISVYTITDTQSYNLIYSARLDFGSMRFSEGVVTMNSYDDSIESLIKNKRSTKFEYPVSGLKESSPLYYDSTDMKSFTKWIDGGSINEMTGFDEIILPRTGNRFFSFPLYMESSELSTKNASEPQDVEVLNFKTEEEVKTFFTARKELTIHLKIYLFFIVTSPHNPEPFKMNLFRMRNGDKTDLSTGEGLTNGIHVIMNYEAYLNLKKGDSLGLSFFGKDYFFILVKKETFHFEIKYTDRNKPVYMDVIKPIRLLESLIGSINETNRTVQCSIDDANDERLRDTLILPAESARGLKNAKVYTSYKEFADWMSVMFGYIPKIYSRDGVDHVDFVHRDKMYSNGTPVEIKMVNDVEFTVEDSMIYSRLKCGYKKVDYDSVNGRDEFRWTEEYDTGINIKDNVLELISPYRADAYGIEFLSNKMGEETSDTESDNDVFFVGCELKSGANAYTLKRDIVIQGVISPSTMFNVMYAPRTIIEANERFIANSIETLKFASSDGNSDIEIDGVAENSNYIIGRARLFTVLRANLKSASAIKYSFNNPLKFKSDGNTYIGYMNEESSKYGQFDGVKFEILVKSIE